MKNVLIRIWHLLVWLAGFAIQVLMIFCIPVVTMLSMVALVIGKVSLAILGFYMFVLFFKGQWMHMTLETFKYGLMIVGVYIVAGLPMILFAIMDFGNYLKDTRIHWNKKQNYLAWLEEEKYRYEQESDLHGHDVHVIDGTFEEVTTQ